MAIRAIIFSISLTISLLVSGCEKPPAGPIRISAIGGDPLIANPNLAPLSPPSELLLLTTAQGLVQLDAAGHIEPALAQSWIVSDDGLRYTFRIRRTTWNNGGKVTARQVVERLHAIIGRASRNPLKPMLSTIDEITAMTDEVLEISLVSPYPNFLQILAQPEMAILKNKYGVGPHLPEIKNKVATLYPRATDEEENSPPLSKKERQAAVQIYGGRSALAIARFHTGQADLVIGGTIGDLPMARAIRPGSALVFDPVTGLLGFSFTTRNGPLGNTSVRQALNMAIDRAALVAALAVPNLQPRHALIPSEMSELPQPVAPEWVDYPLSLRRARAAEIIASETRQLPITLRIAMPDGPGYRLIFAYLQQDWRIIGVNAKKVAMNNRSADLRWVDRVAPVDHAIWYLQQFTCGASIICEAEADNMMKAAQAASTPKERQALLASADQMLIEAVPFIPITAPVRWSLVSPQLTGFKPNQSGHHTITTLVEAKNE